MSDETSEQEIFNSVEAYYSIAHVLQMRREYKRALFYLELALRQDDKHTPSYLLRSFCYMRLFDLDKALADVKTVLISEKKNPQALLLLGEIYYLRGDFEEALSTFHRGLKIRPTVEHFGTGVHKCEMAIGNSCRLYKISLSPELDLTEFYLRAFPPRRESRTNKRIPSQISVIQDDKKPWPEPKPVDIYKKLLKQSFIDYNFLGTIYEDEGKRTKLFKRAHEDTFPDLPKILYRSHENRMASLNCANFLNKRTDLWHKLDPGLKNTKESW